MTNNLNTANPMLHILETINAIEGFDPKVLAVDYADLSSGETRKRLPVMAQMAWFRLKYPEGRIAVSVTPAQGCFVAVAKVYKHYTDSPENYLAEASASRGQSADKPTVSPREWAQTAAIGIALRNAGFGLQFHAAGEGFDAVSADEFDSTEKISDMPTTGAVQPSENKEEAPQTDLAPPISTQPEESPLEKAFKMPCPIGKYRGKTLQEMILLDPNALVWVATKYTDNLEISAAAKLICEHSKELASA